MNANNALFSLKIIRIRCLLSCGIEKSTFMENCVPEMGGSSPSGEIRALLSSWVPGSRAWLFLCAGVNKVVYFQNVSTLQYLAALENQFAMLNSGSS